MSQHPLSPIRPGKPPKQAETDKSVKELTPVTDMAVSEIPSKHARLSLSDIELLLRLKDEGLTQVEIAGVLKCTQSTVSSTLARLKNTPALVQALAQSESVPMLNRWIRASKVAAKRGDHRPAREFIELASPELRAQPGTGGGVGVTIVIGQPGNPVGLPTINVTASSTPVISAPSLVPRNEIDE